MSPTQPFSERTHEERRRHPRYQIDLLAQIHDVDRGVESGLFEVDVANISEGGLKLRLKGLLEDRSRQLVSISYKGTESLCLAEIMWKKFENKQMSYGLRIIRWSRLGETLETLFKKYREKNPPTTYFSSLGSSFA